MGKGCEPRKSKGESAPAVDQGGKKERGWASKGRDEKRTESRKDSSHDEARKARETADEKDLADDESDKREYAALKNKMEARRIAREIQTSHDTLASLQAEQDDVSGKTETVAKAHTGSDRAERGNAIEPKNTTKKSRATRPATGAIVGESDTSAAKGIIRRTDEPGKTKSARTEGSEQEVPSRVPKQTAGKSKTKKSTTVTESSRAATGKTAVQSSGDNSMTDTIGPALVAGALERTIGDSRTVNMMRGITECRVELLSTRQKAKLPVPAAPNNSAESNSVTEYTETGDARLSLSATDLHVQLELPGDVSEETRTVGVVGAVTLEVEKGRMIGATVSTEPCRISLTSVARQGDRVPSCDNIVHIADVAATSVETVRDARADDTPIFSETIAKPAVASVDKSVQSGEFELLELPTAATTIGGIADVDGDVTKTTERRRLLRDIDVAVAMREHFAAINPELNAATTFLSSVCGLPYEAKESGILGLPGPRVSKRDPIATTSCAVEASGNESLPKTLMHVGITASGNKQRGGGGRGK